MHQDQSSIKNISRKHLTYWLIFIGIILVGANLRAPLTSVGSLVSFIREDLSLSHSATGMITTLPLLAFSFLSPLAPKISKSIGMERTILYSLFLLLLGIIIRSLFGVGFLFFGTLFIGLAIAFGNVLIPVIIQLNFPLRVGIVMGFYAVFMNVFGAIASGVSVPISSLLGLGWRGALAFWGILVVFAIIMWIPALRSQKDFLNHEVKQDHENEQQKKSGNIWRSKLAWYITFFMGLQSLIFYTTITWLPDILQSYGYSPKAGGWMLFMMQLSLIPVTFFVPVLAEKMEDQKWLSGLTGIFFILGVLGILSGQSLLVLIAIVMIGMACGSAFSLSMMFFSLRTENGEQAAEISGMAQSFGYLLAAVGPTLFGALHDLTKGWVWPLVMLIGIGILILLFGVSSGKKRTIKI